MTVILSLLLLWHLYLLGKKHGQAWLVGMVYQGLYLIWVFYSGNYGFLVAAIPITLLVIHNHRKWRRDAKENPS